MVGCNSMTNNTDSGLVEAGQLTQFSVIYLSFEDLLEYVNCVVKATYIETVQRGEHFYYKFNIIESLRGDFSESELLVEFTPASFTVVDRIELSWSTYDKQQYETGKNYLLLLKKYLDVFMEIPRYTLADTSLIMELNPDLSINTSKSLMYKEPLKKHIAENTLSSALTVGNLESAIMAKVKNNKLIDKTPYIESDDLDTIIQRSEYVFKVTVGEADPIFNYDDRVTRYCNIITSYKGAINKSEIAIIFPQNKVTENETYIIAATELANTGQKFFKVSSKNSVIDCSFEDHILSLIND